MQFNTTKNVEISSPSLTSPVQCALFKVACNLLSPCYDTKEHIVLQRAKWGVDWVIQCHQLGLVVGKFQGEMVNICSALCWQPTSTTHWAPLWWLFLYSYCTLSWWPTCFGQAFPTTRLFSSASYRVTSDDISYKVSRVYGILWWHCLPFLHTCAVALMSGCHRDDIPLTHTKILQIAVQTMLLHIPLIAFMWGHQNFDLVLLHAAPYSDYLKHHVTILFGVLQYMPSLP